MGAPLAHAPLMSRFLSKGNMAAARLAALALLVVGAACDESTPHAPVDRVLATASAVGNPEAAPEHEKRLLRGSSRPPRRRARPHSQARGTTVAALDGGLADAELAAGELRKSSRRGALQFQHYLDLRRALARVKPYVKRRAQLGTEVLFGPSRSAVEAGGALGALDASLGDGDAREIQRRLMQVDRSIKLIAQELQIASPTDEELLMSASNAAYELGLMVLEAYDFVPLEPTAVLADLRGQTEGIQAVARIAASGRGASTQLQRVEVALQPFTSALGTVAHAHEIRGRAQLVAASGRLGVALRELAKTRGFDLPLPYRARFAVASNTIREPVSAFTLPARRHDRRKGDVAAMAELGRDLFFDARLSRERVRSCAGCHVPSKAFSDGAVVSRSLLADEPLTRNTPTLLYTSLHAAQFWDGRFADAERQALRVIQTPTEMGLSHDALESVIASDAIYVRRFTQLFADGVTAANVARALVAYEAAELVPGKSAIDRFARGDRSALSVDQSAGLDVFAGKGRCARCHVPPLFGGSRPLDFAVPVYSVLGVPTEPKGKTLDADLGRAGVTKRKVDNHAFKVPTVRNVHLTAPYFHHGRFGTLEEVVDFYNDGGGRALGIELPNQDPDVRALELTGAERSALLVFMRAGLRDAVLPEAGR